MANNFKSSFIPTIPKNSSGSVGLQKQKPGILSVGAILIFVLTIVSAVSLFAYKMVLKGDVDNLKSEILIAEKSIDKEAITEMSKFSDKLSVARNIVAKHQAISSFMEIFAESTVSSVSFSSFSFQSATPSSLSVNLQGKASSYGSLALQEDVLKKNSAFSSIDFSNLNLTSTGQISFNMNFSVDPKILIYSVEEENSPDTEEDKLSGEDKNMEDLEESIDEGLDQLDQELSDIEQDSS